ncbi:MAG TPA: DUF418 domain-containing protein [Holophagaceae bacterium]|nr:DUF418 domain-containing protein [Holophagaceae bacterium]
MPDTEGASTPAFQPFRAGDRLLHLDIVRGFALLGVLLMNNHLWMRTPSARYKLAAHPWPGFLNLATDTGLLWLWSGKSMSLFATLFGLGLTLQMDRAGGRPDFAAFVRRRQGALLLLGLLHLTLLWSGDILHVYALVGLAMLPFLGRTSRTLLAWAVGFQLLYLAEFFVPHHGPPVDHQAWIDWARAAYLHGTWLQAAAFRWAEIGYLYLRAGAWFWAGLFALFLLGSAIWRAGVIQDPEGHLTLLRRARAWGLGLGLVLEGLNPLLHAVPGLHLSPAASLATSLAFVAGEPLLCLGYGAALILLVRDPRWAQRLRGLGAVGKLILTNYLMQSLVMTWIYNGYGLGLYDRLGPFAGMLLCLAVFAAQIAFSLWWTARFHFGPVEWLWRGISYGAFPTFRRDFSEAA